jgi:hypothetical protein
MSIRKFSASKLLVQSYYRGENNQIQQTGYTFIRLNYLHYTIPASSPYLTAP